MIAAALRRMGHEEAGQGLVEYLMVIVLAVIGLFALVNLLSETLASYLSQAATALQSMVP